MQALGREVNKARPDLDKITWHNLSLVSKVFRDRRHAAVILPHIAWRYICRGKGEVGRLIKGAAVIAHIGVAHMIGFHRVKHTLIGDIETFESFER